LRKLIWVRADWEGSWETKKEIVKEAIERGADAVLLRPHEVRPALDLGSILIASYEDRPGVSIVVRKLESAGDVPDIEKWAEEISKRGKKAAVVVDVSDKQSERIAARLGSKADFVIVSTKSWKIIPLENLIADFQKLEGRLLAEVRSADEAQLVAQTLEIGTHGVVLDPSESGASEIGAVCERLEALTRETFALIPARVVSVSQAGIGDRACIDTTSMLSVGEGMLVGSQAEGLFLVHSETLPSEFVEPRPFRVNAGGVHSYIRVPGGKTRYLSELKAGDEVLVVNAKGQGRPAVVGRVKIERRPMVLVEAEAKGRVFKVLLQNAETINLVGADGRPVPVTSLAPGQELLVFVELGGRHFGKRVEETIVER
jgi:3-dehydroquinate synthase II